MPGTHDPHAATNLHAATKATQVTPKPEAAGISVIFQGHTLAWITEIKVNHGVVDPVEVVGISNPVRGTGLNAAVCATMLPGKINPGTISITGLGTLGWDNGDVGKRGQLRVLRGTYNAIEHDAILTKFEYTGKVNDLWRCTAEWQIVNINS